MVFKPSQQRTSVKIELLLNGHKLDQVNQVFFGVIVNENLNWKSEISRVANKVCWNNS